MIFSGNPFLAAARDYADEVERRAARASGSLTQGTSGVQRVDVHVGVDTQGRVPVLSTRFSIDGGEVGGLLAEREMSDDPILAEHPATVVLTRRWRASFTDLVMAEVAGDALTEYMSAWCSRGSDAMAWVRVATSQMIAPGTDLQLPQVVEVTVATEEQVGLSCCHAQDWAAVARQDVALAHGLARVGLDWCPPDLSIAGVDTQD